MDKTQRATVGYNHGNGRQCVAFVFACPGQKELLAGKVVAGATGRNLDRLLEYLHRSRPDIFTSMERYDYCICNSSDRVFYKGYLGSDRTLPNRADICHPENLRRLKRELLAPHIRYAIFFGRQACIAMELLEKTCGPKPVLIRGKCHLGMMAINRIRLPERYADRTGTERAAARIRVIAMDVLKKMKD